MPDRERHFPCSRPAPGSESSPQGVRIICTNRPHWCACPGAPHWWLSSPQLASAPRPPCVAVWAPLPLHRDASPGSQARWTGSRAALEPMSIASAIRQTLYRIAFDVSRSLIIDREPHDASELAAPRPVRPLHRVHQGWEPVQGLGRSRQRPTPVLPPRDRKAPRRRSAW